MASCFKSLARTKYIDLGNVEDTKLARVLSTLDLTALGIGSTLGAGIYVLAGQVAKDIAGPAVILSFLIAAVASVLAGLCYAEFGARVPKTGSAYVYSYVTVGEFWAFVIGWNLILEYVIGTASVARAWSSYFDSLINNTISHHLEQVLPMRVSWLGPYPDFFALGITLLLTGILALGVKESSTFNNIFTAINLLVVLYVVICGLFKADIKNWQIPASQIPNTTVSHHGHGHGEGGFFPFGFSGMMAGAASCFYAFVGFDCIATTGEEVKNPQKAIPISIVLCLLFCFLAYFGVSGVLTLMEPYYMLDKGAPLPQAFEHVGWGFAKYVIAVGAVCGLSASLLGAMFPLPRVIYAMADDGLLFSFLARINERFKTPLIATLLSGTFAGIFAMLFSLLELVEMMSIGTLLAYTLVAACVLILRYEAVGERPPLTDDTEDDQAKLVGPRSFTFSEIMLDAFSPSTSYPTELTSRIIVICVSLLGVLIIALCALLIFAVDGILEKKWPPILGVSILGVFILVILFVMVRQPQDQKEMPFKVPFLPLVPCISMFINIYLMLKLKSRTWVRFGAWMGVGFLIYFAYGFWHSRERHRGTKNLTGTDSESDPETPVRKPSENTGLVENGGH